MYNNADDLLKHIGQFKYFENCPRPIINYNNDNVILHDNFIWLTEINKPNDNITCNTYIVNFYAYNAITSVKYLINEIEIIDLTGCEVKCYFSSV